MKHGAQGIALLLSCLALGLGACGGDPGADGASCTVVANADMTSTITCGDASVVIPRGPVGMDGTSCTVVEDATAGTKTITCDDGTMVTITDGDAATCTVVDDPVAGTATITCSDGTTAVVASGAAGGGCTVEPAGIGRSTITCEDGTSVTVVNGSATPPGANVLVTDFHGEEHLLTSGAYEGGAKALVNAVITAATADAAGLVTVDFRVDSRDTVPVPVTTLGSVSATIAKLVPAAVGEASNHWVPYLWRTETVSGSATGDWPNPDGTTALQGSSESAGTTATSGTLTNNGDGTYRYVFRANLTTAMMGTTPITYERSLTHRVVIMMGGSVGPTDDDTFDFVPDGTAVAETREIIETSTCQTCHNRNEFRGHGGNRRSIETCAVCHTVGTFDAHSGESLDLRTMVHKIHAGGELFSIRGPDGIVWNNPATPVDETADNGNYSIWGYRNTRFDWWKVGFPAVIDNCTKCHDGAGAQVDAWKVAPSRAACGSCHDTVDFVTGTGHSGGARANDTACAGCHSDTDIEDYHDFVAREPRNTGEFNATLTVNTPARGYFVDGEAPVVTIALTDAVGGAVIPGTSVVEDPTAESCATVATCTPRDGLFRVASLFVHGPRGRNVPVLTTAARAQVLSTGVGPWDLSAAGANLVLKVDGGRDLRLVDSGGADYTAAANITVNVSAGTFAGGAVAATTDEIVTWLNANVAFNRRAIAFNQGGRVGIRSRNLGWIYSVQLGASAVTSAVFAGELTATPPLPVHLPTGSTAANNVSARIVAANNDPKATRNAADITYQLDAVDDLEPGTYIAQIEFSDRGRTSATNYWAPTVAFVNIQVGTATEEAPVARNCNSCHQSDTAGFGRGFVVDVSRHNKYLRDLAPDMCGGCHDQMPQLASSATSPGFGWTGARPISHRVHGIHYGSSLVYPLATVDYGNGDPVAGRNWDITFPQDVRNCESCHSATSSGTWATEPARLPCSGCHDSDAANGHMRAQTYDPTPVDPWSGDEIESCKACHAPG